MSIAFVVYGALATPYIGVELASSLPESASIYLTSNRFTGAELYTNVTV